MKLLDYIISTQNKSGAIPPAPNALKNLKSAIEGVPFELKQPGMSGIFNMNNMLQGLKILQQQMGDLGNIGNFQQILQQIANGTATYQQLMDAMGDAGSLSAVLMMYQSQGSVAVNGVVDSNGLLIDQPISGGGVVTTPSGFGNMFKNDNLAGLTDLALARANLDMAAFGPDGVALASSIDLNNVTKNGIYTGQSNPNSPTPNGFSLYVQKYAATYIYQRLCDHGTNLVIERWLNVDTWTAWNIVTLGYTPANKAGDTFTGDVLVQSSPSFGYSRLNSGDATHPGYVSFFTSDGTRRGYIGWKDSANNLLIQSENGWGYNFAGGPVNFGVAPTFTDPVTTRSNLDMAAYGPSGVYLPTGDANTLTKNGVYDCNPAVANLPTVDWYVVTNTIGAASDPRYIQQTARHVFTSRMYIRTNNLTVWTAWSEIAVTSNTLTFTPTITWTAGSGTASASMRYTKIGQLVFIQNLIVNITSATAGSNINLNVPIAASGSGSMLSGRETNVTGKTLQGVVSSSSLISFFNYDNTLPITTGYQLLLSGFYET